MLQSPQGLPRGGAVGGLHHGKTYTKRVDIWPDAILEYVHLNTINGEFTTRVRYPDLRHRSADQSKERD